MRHRRAMSIAPASITESEISRAALHAGHIGPGGGVVGIRIRGGRDDYEAAIATAY
ncbi:LCCL domain-containing protein [Sphingomicrobium astaxanthinifaciens]|uniref:LCCL domain-containing protein n=1 Tax=Sphingomicrobium astaxanthinifaciens TaxID=1227949 RepID=UPI00389AF20C